MSHDLVIRGGTIVDGSGRPGETGDVAIGGGRLQQVGGRADAGRREIDAAGLAVAPGFIDPHTHYDAQIWWDSALTPSCWHGITTTVMGNCGFTLAPCAPEGRERIARMLERVEGMSLPALQQGIDWQWESFPEFLDAIEARRPALNVGCLIGHSALRYFVLDDEATERASTSDEIETMCGLVRGAMQAGALGFSTSQAPTHVGGDGKPVPSRLATDDEIVALAGVMAEFGRGAMELVVKNLTDVSTSIASARSSGRPVTYLGGMTEQSVRDVEAARRDGLTLVPQTSCRPALMDFTLEDGVVFDQLECWKDVMTADRDGKIRTFRDPAFRARFRDEIAPREGVFIVFKPRWDAIKVIMTGRDDLRELVGRSVADLSAARGEDPFDTFFDLAIEDGLALEYSYKLSEDTDRSPQILSDDYLIGLSDAGAHLTLLSDAAYTTYLLGRWVRERQTLTLESAVRKLTRVPAEFWGIRERGLLTEGYWADVVLFDPDTVIDRDAELVYDLPGGGPRLVPRAEGVEAVIVNGEVTVERGELTDARAGQVVRG